MDNDYARHVSFFVLLISALLLLAGVSIIGNFIAIGICGVCLLMVPFYLYLRVIDNNEELLKPEVFNLASYIFIFGFTGLGFLIFNPYKNYNIFLMILIGWVALNCGLYWGRHIRLADRGHFNEQWSADKVKNVLNIWLVVNFLVTIAYFWRMGEIPIFSDIPEEARVILAERGGGYLRTIIYSSIVWIMLAYTAIKNGTYTSFSRFVVVAVFYLVVFLCLGNRAPMVTILFMLLLMKTAYDDILKDVKWYHVVSLSIIVATIGLVFGLTGTYRIVNDARVSEYKEYKQLIEQGDYFTIFTDQIASYVSHGVENFSKVYENVPEKFGYKYGATYLYPIETVLPGKQYTLDMRLKHVFDMRFAGGGFVPSTLGEAYINFGKAGIVLVPFIIGFLLSVLYAEFKKQKIGVYGLLYLFLLYYLSIHMVSGILSSSIFVIEAIFLIIMFNRIVTIKTDET